MVCCLVKKDGMNVAYSYRMQHKNAVSSLQQTIEQQTKDLREIHQLLTDSTDEEVTDHHLLVQAVTDEIERLKAQVHVYIQRDIE